MEPDRFDDVESTILEAPEPPDRGDLRRRVALVMAVGVIVAGGLAAGASALTGGGDEPTPAAPKVTRNADGIPFVRSGPECKAGHGKRRHQRSSSSAPRY